MPTRGYDMGPYDSSEVDQHLYDELLVPAHELHTPEHTSATSDRHVWTNSLAFYIPHDTHVNEYVLDDGGVPGLQIDVGTGSCDEPFSVSVTVFASPTSEHLWQDSMMKRLVQWYRDEAGITPALRRGQWGITVTGRMKNQEMYTLASDGPGWTVRFSAFGYIITPQARRIVRSMMDSCVVRRDLHTPYEPLSLALIDRRLGRDIFSESVDDSIARDSAAKLLSGQLPSAHGSAGGGLSSPSV